MEGNERITASAAVVLFLLLAVEGVTILFIRPLLSVHMFVGLLLIPPVALKLASTGWRFVRYYGGREEYVRRGPPALPLRLLAPVVVLSTVVVFGTGVALLFRGPGRGLVLGLHKASFVVWLGATGIHVLVYLGRVPRVAAADWRERSADARRRRFLVAGAVVAGAVLAVSLVGSMHSWVHWAAVFHGDGGGDG